MDSDYGLPVYRFKLLKLALFCGMELCHDRSYGKLDNQTRLADSRFFRRDRSLERKGWCIFLAGAAYDLIR